MNIGKMQKGVRNPTLAFGHILKTASKKVGQPILEKSYPDDGFNVLEEDWDTLVIFDCARYDIFTEVVGDKDVSPRRSIASVTANFIRRTFSNRDAFDTVYLSANPIVGKNGAYMNTHKLVKSWEGEPSTTREGQENPGIMDPDPVLERSIALHDKYPNKRHIVHLLPPHTPHELKNGSRIQGDSPYRNYQAAREGEIPAAEMRVVYKENLLNAVELAKEAFENVNGKIVFTSDHGELLGEGMPLWMKILHHRWGNQFSKYDFGHYSNCNLRELREVPWYVFQDADRRDIKSEKPESTPRSDGSIENHLKALGYR